jgi:hypothetical protein
MQLPMQREPVQRTIASQPWANRGTGVAIEASGVSGTQGVTASDYGVQASDWRDWAKRIGGIALDWL